MRWVIALPVFIALALCIVLWAADVALSHPHPRYTTDGQYHGFTDQALASCPGNPAKSHDWHNSTGTETQHEVRTCCWCGQKRFVDVRVIGKERSKKYDTASPVAGSHGTVSTAPTVYTGVNNPQPVPLPSPISGDI